MKPLENIWVLRLMGPLSISIMLIGLACDRITVLTDRYEGWMEKKLAVAWAKKRARS